MRCMVQSLPKQYSSQARCGCHAAFMSCRYACRSLAEPVDAVTVVYMFQANVVSCERHDVEQAIGWSDISHITRPAEEEEEEGGGGGGGSNSLWGLTCLWDGT